MRTPLPFTARDAIAYATLPRIIPRLKSIGFHFPFVAYLMASFYAMVRILPPSHPYLSPATIGTYSVRQVFIEAARHLRFDRRHIDQILVFALLAAAFILMVLQFGLMFLYLMIGVAQAGVGFTSLFATPDPTNDIAMILLDRVFGLPGMFNSCISTPAVCDPTSSYLTPYEPPVFPTPFHVAMHSLFGFFSLGLGLVAAAIIFYYLVVVILESVHDGVPFGSRFASAYAPMRLCLAVFFLIPLPTPMNATGVIGYNTGQYLVLYLAKVGSGFGTNGWNVFNNTFTIGGKGIVAAGTGYGPLNPAAPDVSAVGAMIAQPKAGMVDPLLQFMFIAQSCRAMYERGSDQVYAVDAHGDIIIPKVVMKLEPYIIAADNTAMKLAVATTYDDALLFVKNGNIRVRFGVPVFKVGIKPVCGELTFRSGNWNQPGAKDLLANHFALIAQMWTDDAIIKFGDRMAVTYLPIASSIADICGITVPFIPEWGSDVDTCGAGQASAFMPKSDYYNRIRNDYQAFLETFVVQGRDKQIAALSANVDNKILDRGWAGAGIWYNRLADMNGTLFDAAKSLPTITRMPEVMESVMRERQTASQDIEAKSRFTPAASESTNIRTYDLDTAKGLNAIYLYFQGDGIAKADLTTKTENPIFDLMNRLFGTGTLFAMRDSVDVNPMVQIIAMGKSIVDAAFFNILVGGGVEFAGGILQQLGGWQQKLGAGLNTLGDAWFTVASIGLGIGLMLYYVIPFLPFMYFFFAVIKWVQSVFEAMIGVPMWALAHLRIDGDGIPTEAAEGGYFLLLEIVLRPILTVIGMVASFVIFTGMVYTMNDIFNLLVVNVTGYNPASGGTIADLEIKRGTIDQFFYTVMYAILVYIMAITSFKLIDLVPANILRWIGSSAKNIIDETGDPIPGLIKSTYIGAFGLPVVQQGGMLGQAVKGMREATEGAAKAVGEVVGAANKGLKP